MRVVARLLPVALILLSLSTTGTTCIAIATPTPTLTLPPPTATLVPLTSTPSPSPTLPPPTATPEPQTLRFGLPDAPAKLDPAVIPVDDESSLLVSAQLYDTLVQFEPGTTAIEPALATEWMVSPDGLTWDFKLRPDVVFHDGTPLTAEMVAWNFRRWMDGLHPAHEGDFRYWEGLFRGFDEEQTRAEAVESLVVRVEAPDAATFRIVLNKPYAPLLHNLALPAFAILQPDAVMAQGAQAYGALSGAPAVGTGPFRVLDWSDQEITLAANHDYWAGWPGVESLVFRVIDDPAARLAALQNREIEGFIAPDDGSRLAIGVAGDGSRLTDYRIVLDPRPTTAFLNFNLGHEYLRNVDVRRGIAHAINRPALLAAAFGPDWIPASQMLSPGIWGYNEAIEPYTYDPERARALLDAAQVPEGYEIELWYPDRPRPYLPNPEAAAQAIADDLAAVGIAASLQTEEWSAYLADRRQGAFAMWLLGWTGHNGDPDSFFFYHFGVPTPREGNYHSEVLQELLLRGQVIADPDIRVEVYEEAARILHEDVPRLFLAHPAVPMVLAPEVTGLLPNPAGPERFDHVRLQP